MPSNTREPSPPSDDELAHHTAQARARAHRRVALAILATNCGFYAALIVLIAYAKPFLGQLVAPGLSLGIVLGTAVTILAWLLTLVYVQWANASGHASGRP